MYLCVITKAKNWPHDGPPGSDAALLSSAGLGISWVRHVTFTKIWVSLFIHGSLVTSCKQLLYCLLITGI